jgi:hypothetical protein
MRDKYFAATGRRPHPLRKMAGFHLRGCVSMWVGDFYVYTTVTFSAANAVNKVFLHSVDNLK